MANTQIHLTKSGVYLFGSSMKVTAQLNREILIVLTAPLMKACGTILYETQTNPKELQLLLDTLLKKTLSRFNVRAHELQVKVFGLSNGNRHLIDLIRKWVKGQELRMGAEDTGRDVIRNIILNCETGAVGVSYAEGFHPDHLTFLSDGSARNRNQSAPIDTEVLILTTNPVKRLLAKQAVEEQSNCSATAPKDPKEFFKRKSKQFPWSVILFFDDLPAALCKESVLLGLKRFRTEMSCCWIGEIPRALASSAISLIQLPSLEPDRVGNFKKELSEVLSNPQAFYSDVSLLIPFKRTGHR